MSIASTSTRTELTTGVAGKQPLPGGLRSGTTGPSLLFRGLVSPGAARRFASGRPRQVGEDLPPQQPVRARPTRVEDWRAWRCRPPAAGRPRPPVPARVRPTHGAAHAFRRSGIRQVGEADWRGHADAGTDRRGDKEDSDRPRADGQERDAARGQQEPCGHALGIGDAAPVADLAYPWLGEQGGDGQDATAAVPARGSRPWLVARAGRNPIAAPSREVDAARTSVGIKNRRSVAWRARSSTV